MIKILKRVRAPVRIDFGGGTTDIKPFSEVHGGAVLNCTINRYVYGELIATDKFTKLSYKADVPTSSGLGTSSAMNVVWISLVTRLKDKKEIAETVFRLEHLTKEYSINGRQDQYASCFGGINFFEFNGDKVKITPLKLNKRFIKELEKKLVLVYTGISHYSGVLNKIAIENFKKGKNIEEFLNLKKIAYEMKEFLEKEDLYGFSYLLNKETEERKKLSKKVIPPDVQKIINEGMKNGAIAAKICGSGGGGSILFFAEYPEKLKRYFGKKVINFNFEFEGLKWLK